MARPSLPTPPPVKEPQTVAAKSGTTVDALPVDSLRNILRRLSLADLLRAALACHRWRRVAARCIPRTAPLLGYFFHPTATGRCVHAAGKIYWHICNSYRMLVLDPATLHLSYLLAPAVLSDHFCTYRVGETPEDGRLCLLAVGSRSRQLQLWVRAEARGSDNGWFLEREMLNMRVVWDAVPGLPNDLAHRIFSVWPSDMDAGRTGKVFIRTIGYGRYSLHLDTAKIEPLHTKHGKEYGHPIYAYFLAWPPAFLAPEY
uniref:Uncharacterized protein n=1 Tax=Aegilops tauschii TaxID=37682 RepID=M8D320_AEGTA